MNISGTYQGENVRFVQVDLNGADINIVYVDQSNNLKVAKTTLDRTTSATTLSSSVTFVA
jgi:hypothetical protein